MSDFLLMVGGALFAMFISGIVNYKKTAWVGLTDDEIMDMYNEPQSDAEMIAFGREVEAKLKEKNT